MSHRLSRKEIKRDEFMESVGRAIEYTQSHARKLVAIGLGVVGALIIVGLLINYSQRQEVRADDALTLALETFQAEIDPVAANPGDATDPTFANEQARQEKAQALFESVRTDFSRSNAAAIATVYLGQIAASSGDLAGARSFWEEYLRGNSKQSLAVEVQVNVMALDRAEGRGADLVTRLRAMLSGVDEGLPQDLLWYQLGLTLDQLDREGEALEAYQRLIEDFPQSAYAAAARERSGTSTTPFFGT